MEDKNDVERYMEDKYDWEYLYYSYRHEWSLFSLFKTWKPLYIDIGNVGLSVSNEPLTKLKKSN